MINMSTCLKLNSYKIMLFHNLSYSYLLLSIIIEKLRLISHFVSDVLICKKCNSYLPHLDLLNHCISCPAMLRLNVDYRFVCFDCDYHTRFSHAMQGHLRTHTGETPYKCEHCAYKSKYPSDLKRHVKIRHFNSTVDWVQYLKKKKKKICPTDNISLKKKKFFRLLFLH